DLFGQRFENNGRYRLNTQAVLALEREGIPEQVLFKLKLGIQDRPMESETEFLDRLRLFLAPQDYDQYKYTILAKATNFIQLYYLVTGSLVTVFLVCAWLVRSKFGKLLTAIRDNENRVLALGYNTAWYKTFIFALAGGIAGFAGALYVSALGTA